MFWSSCKDVIGGLGRGKVCVFTLIFDGLILFYEDLDHDLGPQLK